jgi:hypothetical protein
MRDGCWNDGGVTETGDISVEAWAIPADVTRDSSQDVNWLFTISIFLFTKSYIRFSTTNDFLSSP